MLFRSQLLKNINNNELYIKSKNIIKLEKYIAVYDLEIEKVHNFPIGNGLVVHNSKDMSDSLAGALFNATLHKQSLVDNNQLFSTAIDVNTEIDGRQEILDNMQESMLQHSRSSQQSKLASDKLDELINGFGSGNILSW